jgi:DNA-binding transcriptional ArsR family regulator
MRIRSDDEGMGTGMSETHLEPLLQRAIKAFLEPTRAAILMELARSGELTATHLARRLGLTANTISHHLRVLSGLGLLEPPRVVPGKTYVEKFYQVKRELVLSPRDPGWIDRAQQTLTVEERKAVLINLLLWASQIIRQAALRYERMDANALDDLFGHLQEGMVSINSMHRDRLQYRLAALRELLAREVELFPETEDETNPPNIVIMAGLPLFWDLPLPGETDN